MCIMERYDLCLTGPLVEDYSGYVLHVYYFAVLMVECKFFIRGPCNCFKGRYKIDVGFSRGSDCGEGMALGTSLCSSKAHCS